MIIEFIGSTGAGKTTLASEVQRRLAANVPATTSFDLLAELLGCRHVTNPTLKNLIADLVGFPFFLCSLNKHCAFFVFAVKALTRHTSNPFFAINYLRGIVRRIGTYELLRRYKRDRIVLVDEGTILSAHLLFVFSNTTYHHEEIRMFASLVPLPELVICIRAPVDRLVQRSLKRNDVRREMRSKNQKLVEEYVSRAAKMFDQLTHTREIRDRVLIVANPASKDDECGVVADRIARFILNYQLSVEPIRTIPAGQIQPASLKCKKHVNQN